MDEVLDGVDRDRVKVYGGQILVHTSGFDEHLKVLESVLHELQTSNLKAALKECQFGYNELVYLGKCYLIQSSWLFKI